MNGFQYCTAMVAVKDPLLRTALADAILALGFRVVLRADGLAEAVAKLIQIRVSPTKAGIGELDLLVTRAAPGNAEGNALIRWVRAHADTPDPFLPILAIGPVKLGENNQLTMGIGETAALTPGFGADDLAAAVYRAIVDQRHFVKVGKYFGPDRRVTEAHIPEERRESDLPYNKAGVRFYPLPTNRGEKLGKDFKVNMQSVGAVRAALDNHIPTFRTWVEKRSKQIEAAPFRDCDSSPDQCRAIVSKLGEISADAEAKAAIFGFPLISAIAASLRHMTELEPVFTRTYIDLVTKHGKAMKAALLDKDRSYTSDFATGIMEELQRIVDRYYATHPELLEHPTPQASETLQQ